jgi:hypothetical protein
VTTLDSVPAELSLTEFQGKIVKWREATTTSPSGRHLGCYKSLFTPGIYDEAHDSVEFQAFRAKQQAIAHLLLAIINYAIRHQYVLRRWTSIVNTMIFKETGVYQIHRLRVIHIYEADFNLLLAVKWRRLLHHADQAGLVHARQYGGRPGCEAQSLTFLEELKYDISHLSRRTIFNFDNDAMSCYDRIIVALASLINRKYGQHRNIVAVHAKTLENARYKLRTAKGISDLEYSHCPAFPLYGSGQGAGNSPCIWLFISSTLFDIHERHAHGASFSSPDGTHQARLTMVGFVDDSTGTCNDFQPAGECSIEDLAIRMQHDAQLWNDLLFCSGGRLELGKCSFHVLHFKFKPDGTPVPLIQSFDHGITVSDATTGERVSIPAKTATDAHKTLGHYKAPADPRQKRQLQALIERAKQLSVLLSTSPISRSGAMLAYRSMYVAAVGYALPQSFFTKAQLDQAQSKSMGSIFAKCGYVRTTATPLIYAPIELGGAGFVPWYTLQGVGQVQLFVKHWRTASLISQVLRIDLAWSQWQAGISTSILQDVHTALPWLECRWLRSLRGFLQFCKGQLHVDHDFVIPSERHGDIHIMDYAQRCRLFTEAEMKLLNYCRLYLHVTTVSELFNASGTAILPHMFNCRRSPWFNPNQYVTRQRRPSEYQIRHRWQRFCREFCQHDGTIAMSLSFGNWISKSTNQLLRRESYYVPGIWPILYHWHEDCYWECHPLATRPGHFLLVQATHWTPTSLDTPVDAKLATEHSVTLCMTSLLAFPSPSLSPICHDFEEYLTTLPTWERDLLTDIDFKWTPYALMDHLTRLDSSVNIILVSDGGSRQNQTMSFGFILGTSTNEVFIEHSGPAHGETTSFRAEGTGQLAGALLLYHLQRYTDTTIPAHLLLRLICDNSGLIQRLQKRQEYEVVYPNATLAPDWDLTEQIYRTHRSIGHPSTTYEWVKGHQDDTTSTSQLDTVATYNIRADALATEYMHLHSDLRPQVPLYPATRCQLELQGRTITSHYAIELRRAAAEPPFFHYLRDKHSWSSRTLADVDWSVFRSAARNYSASDVHLLKLVHDKLPTNSHKAKFQPWVAGHCSYCSQRETFDHLMQCHHALPADFRQRVTTAVRAFGERRQIPEDFITAYLDGLQQWLQGHEPVLSHPGLDTAQSAIGWRLLPRGFLSSAWAQYLELLLQPSWQADDTSISSEEDTLEVYEDNQSSQGGRVASHHHDVRTVLSELVRVVWSEMSSFWERHLDHIHTNNKLKGSPAKLAELQSQIRLLHSHRPKVLPQHRDTYFHADVTAYLEQSEQWQLEQYLLHYKPVILASIRRETARQRQSSATTATLFTFAGFTRHRRPTPRCPLPTRPLEETPHHKHTRWRPSVMLLHNFRQFFQPTTPPP